MDKKAKQILLKTHWSSKGWKETYDISKEDYEYAKSKGVMFEPFTITHDELISELLVLKEKISFEKILQAFLTSLSSRDLRLRSSLLSYLNIISLKKHDFKPGSHSTVNYCDICSAQKIEIDDNLNVLNFERVKWGGVRHYQPIYNLLDLKLFSKLSIDPPSKSDIICLESILFTIEEAKAEDKVKDLQKSLKSVIESNSQEREMLINIFAHLGILAPPNENWHPDEKVYWVFTKRWRGKHNYRKEMVEKYFGKW